MPHNLLHVYRSIENLFTRFFSVTLDLFSYAPHSALFRFIHRTCPFVFHKIFDLMSDVKITTYKADLYEEETFAPRHSMRNGENFGRITEKFIQLRRDGRIISKLGSINKTHVETTV